MTRIEEAFNKTQITVDLCAFQSFKPAVLRVRTERFAKQWGGSYVTLALEMISWKRYVQESDPVMRADLLEVVVLMALIAPLRLSG